ncbi:hypothetical protein QR680_001154 [Steinernema hermaphroditum]|uniref:[histone H3]-trimethyl-L-lysine(9) demethylase n=1 Tax=Steinernema hermaphroditum TaxID=289476 RepID=A0AA39GX44_9BILA|nr:hypothetical protein QR680_001154 [Steinernema hermaphroditum]
MVEKCKYDTCLANVPRNQRKYNSKTLVLHPTAEEFRSFSGCVESLERKGAHLVSGIAKIVPPSGWHPRPRRKNDYRDVDHKEIKTPVEEIIIPGGYHQTYLKVNKEYETSLKVSEFRTIALSEAMCNPVPQASVEETVQKYWDDFELLSLVQSEEGIESENYKSAIYGADVEGSIYEDGVAECNVGNLQTILDLLSQTQVKIPGVNTCYLYFGMWRTTFPWHAEDVDLYSINYLHYGAPKFWYAVSSEYADRFERVAGQMFPDQSKKCNAFLRHKNYQIHPDILRKYNIPFETMIQYPGEVIITFPRGYHMGFNMGYNCAESTNFALDRWIDYGKNATTCSCSSKGVSINMTCFMEEYRPNEVEPWKNYWYTASTKPIIAPSKSLTENRLQSRPSREPKVWMKAYNLRRFDVDKLWSDHAIDFQNEMKFNEYRGLYSPYCAICQYFWPDPLLSENTDVPERSARAATDTLFTKQNDRKPEQDYYLSNFEIKQYERSLIQCTSCKVVVHKACYPCGVFDGGHCDRSAWKCLRCQEPNQLVREAASCHLCKLRGGALIPAKKGRDDGGFVHIVCALANRRTWFPDPSTKTLAITMAPKKQNSDPIDCPLTQEYLSATSEFFSESLFECDMCGKLGEGLVTCIKCDEDRPSLYHATCARAAGLILQRRDWPILTTLVCEHDLNAFSQNSQEMFADLCVNDEVIAWIDDGAQVLKGVVTSVSSTKCCAVEFMDSSSSCDVSPGDITACACKLTCEKGNGHVTGARVFVAWEDGRQYGGYFHGMADVKRYTIRIGENTLEMARDELYGPNDYIPPKVVEKYRPPKPERDGENVPPCKKSRMI